MSTVLRDLAELPQGAHALALYSDREEAAAHAVRFIRGAPPSAPVSYWVASSDLAQEYNDRLASVAPERVGCVAVLDHEQVDRIDGKLRPTREVIDFVSEHPDGVTAGGDTLSLYWDLDSVPEYLEYEEWFDEQPRTSSRFLCPYDLRTVPAEVAPAVLSRLAKHHSHVVLSSSTEPAVRLLQLFLFGSPEELPERLRGDLRWATDRDFVENPADGATLELTPRGREVVREWGERTTVDW
jgi:hypothetical protein